MSSPVLNYKRIRIKIESDKFANALDLLASATPKMYRGNDAQFEVGIFWNALLIDASNIATLTLSIWTADRKTRLASKTIAAASITANPTDAGWADGTQQHAAFPFTGTEMNWALTGTLLEETFFLVVAGVTNHTPGHDITYGVSAFTLVEDAEGIAGTPPVNNPNYYTQDEADARFIPAWGDQYVFRTRNGFLEFYTQEDGHWHAAIPKLQDGLLTFSPGPPVD